jgi:uncharacterized protein (DUF1501 family)
MSNTPTFPQPDAYDTAVATELHRDIHPGFSRRRFLQLAGGGVAGAALFAAMPELSAFAAPPTGSDGLLLTVWLGGGNDGLNMLAPVDDGKYRDARGNIALDPATALRIDNGLAFHPALKYVHSQWATGRVAAIAGVGAGRYDLSHFAMADSVLRGAADNQPATTGWLGRWMDNDPASTPLTSVSIGGATPAHLLGERQRGATLPTSLPWNTLTGLSAWDPSARRVAAELRTAATVPSPLGTLGDSTARSNAAGLDLNTTLIPRYGTLGNDWTANRPFRVAAQLLAAGVGIRVAHITVSGFDSHTGQNWMQNDALGRLDKGLAAFFAELDPALVDRVAVVVFSEFGRTARVNGSGGTDHGTASTWLTLGSRVRGGLYGTVPNVANLDSSGYMKPAIDFRDVWATLAETWLRADPAQLLGPGRVNLGFAGDPTGGPALAPPPPPPPVVVTTPAPVAPAMVAKWETWTNVQGWALGTVALGTPPSTSTDLLAVDVPNNTGDIFASRIRTLITVPTTGDWVFSLACDDQGALHLSTDASKASTRLIAYVDSWTGQRAWNTFPTQTSAPIRLEAGKKYYLEAFSKEGFGGDHLSVAVQGPGVRRQVIPSDWCSQPGDVGAGGWNPLPGFAPVQVDRWQSASAVWALTSITAGAAPTGQVRAPRLVSLQERLANLATRHRCWLTVPETATYTIAAAAPSAVRINLAAGPARTDKLSTVVNAAGWMSPHKYDARPGQMSAPITLTAGVLYYMEVWAAHGNAAEHLTVAISKVGAPLAAIHPSWVSDCGTTGAGVWDPAGTSNAVKTAPTAPRNLSVAPSGSSIVVRFDPPASIGTNPLTGYVVRSVSPTGSVIETKTASSPVTLTHAGMTSGAKWSVSVAASSAAGTGAYSASSPVTFATVTAPKTPATVLPSPTTTTPPKPAPTTTAPKPVTAAPTTTASKPAVAAPTTTTTTTTASKPAVAATTTTTAPKPAVAATTTTTAPKPAVAATTTTTAPKSTKP